MKDFKIAFPSGSIVNKVNEENLDVILYFETGEIYTATCFSLENIRFLMEHSREAYFWAAEMFVVRDWSKEGMRNAVTEIIRDRYLDQVFTKVERDDKWRPYSEVVDMTI